MSGNLRGRDRAVAQLVQAPKMIGALAALVLLLALAGLVESIGLLAWWLA